ncbi:MAG: hypothetical protein ACRD2J_00305 [Thermoanaerobaculia bacterium]
MQLERGTVHLFYRPRVERPHPATLEDVQRTLFALVPENGTAARLIAIGRKRIPRAGDSDPRFWGWVDAVAKTPEELEPALCERRYMTKTRGERHLPECRRFADGVYTLESHGTHTHLLWRLDPARHRSGPAAELAAESEADFIVAVVNPATLEAIEIDIERGEEAEARLHLVTPFPRRLQDRFGDRRFTTLDPPEFLDYEGAELIFIAVPKKSRRRVKVERAELGKAGEVEFGVG